MIEMLGVLAIIAVLTVGGIAGYSKAMKKYQANKVVGEIIPILAKTKELFEHDNWYNLYKLNNDALNTLGLCLSYNLSSNISCLSYQRTPVGDIEINYSFVSMQNADAELCISAFNNIVIPLKGNIQRFYASADIKNPDDVFGCADKCFDQLDHDDDFDLGECMDKCHEEEENMTELINIEADEKDCEEQPNCLNLYDPRVVTEVSAFCNRGFNKKSNLTIVFKAGFIL